MKFLSTLMFSILIFGVVSCGPRVQTSQPNNVDLSKYDSFAYLPNTNADVPNNRYNDEEVNAMIINSINNNLRQEGYNLNRDNPDLLVLVSTKINPEMATETDPVYATYPYNAGITTVSPYYDSYYYYGYNTYTDIVGYDTDTYSYEEGTLVVQLVDSETKNTVWKGIAADAIYDQTSTSAIENMVGDIFEEYPLNN